MKATWEKIEKNKVELRIEADADQVAAALDKAFKKVVAKVNVPGFRKGKVPRFIFEAKFGVESLYQEALDILLPEAYMNAVRETGVEPVDSPEIEIEQFGKGQALKFKAKVVVKPEVQLGEYRGIEVPQKDENVTEEEIEAELKRLQERHAELVVKEGAAEKGDIVVIDFEGKTEDGEPVGNKTEKYRLELGSGSFIPGFEDQIVGMTGGEEKEISVTFPENYHVENLRSKPAVFKIKLHEIKSKLLPELDDEFAKDVSEFETLEELKRDIENRLKENKKIANQRETESTVVEKASANAVVDIPEVMITNEVDNMYRDMSNRMRLQGLSFDAYMRAIGKSEAEMKEELKEEARRRVRNNLVLEAIAKAENISVSDEEVDQQLEKLANQYQRSVGEIRSILTKNGTLDTIRHDLTIRKTIEFLVQHSKQVASVA